MDRQQFNQHKLSNTVQSVLLIGAMAFLLGLLGWLLAGASGVVMALIVCVLVVTFGPSWSPRLILSLYRAQPISAQQAPGLLRIVAELSQRAGLQRPPRLYYIPSQVMNAFAVGSQDDAAIGLTDGLIRRLQPRELAAVLAHEISHVRYNDMWVMNLADVLSRMTIALSQAGLFLLFISVPLILFGLVDISLLALLLLIFAPTLAALLQLALSRTREFDADLGAAELTGDPRGLAAALQKLERYQGGWLEQIFLPGRRLPDPAWLRTHPPTEERIARLMELSGQEIPPLYATTPDWDIWPRAVRRPHWHWHGLWY